MQSGNQESDGFIPFSVNSGRNMDQSSSRQPNEPTPNNIPFYRQGGGGFHNSGQQHDHHNRNPQMGYNRGNRRRGNDQRQFQQRPFRPAFKGTHLAETDISQFYHPSMLEDPWARFEQQRSTGPAHGEAVTTEDGDYA